VAGNAAHERGHHPEELGLLAADEGGRRRPFAAALEIAAIDRDVDEDRNHSCTQNRHERHVQLRRHRMQEQHPVTASKAGRTKQRRALPRLSIELGEGGRARSSPVLIDDGRSIPPLLHLHTQQRDDVHGS
jgi:hypothetical protein